MFAARAAPLSHLSVAFSPLSLHSLLSPDYRDHQAVPAVRQHISHGGASSASECANAPRRSDQQLRPVLADLVDGVLHLALDHASQGKPEGVVVVEVLGVVDEQLHVGCEGLPRLLADVLSSLVRVGLRFRARVRVGVSVRVRVWVMG